MRRLGTLTLGVLASAALSSAVLAQAVPSQSGPAAKELIDLMTKAKTDCVVRASNVFGGYVAALHVPGAKLTVVSARFLDTRAMEYKVYQKDCMGAYADLSAAMDAVDRVVIDDIAGDGLVAMPKKDVPRDGITREGKSVKFDGDPKLLKQQKSTPDEFQKNFSSADTTYSELLRLLTAELKK